MWPSIFCVICHHFVINTLICHQIPIIKRLTEIFVVHKKTLCSGDSSRITSRPRFCYSSKNVQSSGGVNWAGLFNCCCNLNITVLEAAELAGHSSKSWWFTVFTPLSQDWPSCHSCCTWETLIFSKIYVTLWPQSKSAYRWMDSGGGNHFTAFWIVFWTGWPSSHRRHFCSLRTAHIRTARPTKKATGWPELCPSMPSWRRVTQSPFCSATSRNSCGCGSP